MMTMPLDKPCLVSPELGFSNMVCRWVNDAMGEEILVECCCPVVFGVPVGVAGVECETICPRFMKASNHVITCGSFSPDSDVLIS
jgi:hypothetical protein